MNRSRFDWNKAERRHQNGTVEQRVFGALKKMIALRKEMIAFADFDNRQLLDAGNSSLLAFSRTSQQNSRHRVLVIGNFNVEAQSLLITPLLSHGFFQHDGMKDICSGNRIYAQDDVLLMPALTCYWLTE